MADRLILTYNYIAGSIANNLIGSTSEGLMYDLDSDPAIRAIAGQSEAYSGEAVLRALISATTWTRIGHAYFERPRMVEAEKALLDSLHERLKHLGGTEAKPLTVQFLAPTRQYFYSRYARLLELWPSDEPPLVESFLAIRQDHYGNLGVGMPSSTWTLSSALGDLAGWSAIRDGAAGVFPSVQASEARTRRRWRRQ